MGNIYYSNPIFNLHESALHRYKFHAFSILQSTYTPNAIQRQNQTCFLWAASMCAETSPGVHLPTLLLTSNSTATSKANPTSEAGKTLQNNVIMCAVLKWTSWNSKKLPWTQIQIQLLHTHLAHVQDWKESKSYVGTIDTENNPCHEIKLIEIARVLMGAGQPRTTVAKIAKTIVMSR